MTRSKKRKLEKEKKKPGKALVKSNSINVMFGASCNLIVARSYVREFLQNDKTDGVESAHYFYHFNNKQINAIDSQAQFDSQSSLYSNQGIVQSKEIPVSESLCLQLGCKSATIKVFRKEGALLWNQLNPDMVSMAFGYLPANCENTIVEVIL